MGIPLLEGSCTSQVQEPLIEWHVRRVVERFAADKVGTIVLHDVPAARWTWGWCGLDLEPRMAFEALDMNIGQVLFVSRDSPGMPNVPAHLRLREREPCEAAPGGRSQLPTSRKRVAPDDVSQTVIAPRLGALWRPTDPACTLLRYAHERTRWLPLNWRDIVGSRPPDPSDIGMDRITGTLVLGAEGTHRFE